MTILDSPENLLQQNYVLNFKFQGIDDKSVGLDFASFGRFVVLNNFHLVRNSHLVISVKVFKTSSIW